jgi:methylenetetrahydrofolate dehydrogenase (NADP+)/methenyltetrahydrofolate cyclohydrolase
MVVWIRGDGLHKEARRWAAEHVRRLEERYGITPKLAVLLLNDDPVELETQKRYVSLKAAGRLRCMSCTKSRRG